MVPIRKASNTTRLVISKPARPAAGSPLKLPCSLLALCIFPSGLSDGPCSRRRESLIRDCGATLEGLWRCGGVLWEREPQRHGSTENRGGGREATSSPLVIPAKAGIQ